MRLSRVSTTHPLLPASLSQISSWVPFGKRFVDRSTSAPASHRAVTTESLSSDSSRKNVSGSGGFEVELAADGIPDRFFAGTVFFREDGHGVTRLELLGKRPGRDGGAGDHRPAK